MTAPGIAVYSAATVIAEADVQLAVRACSEQAAEFCAAWARLPVEITYYADRTKIPVGTPTVAIVDVCDDANALAYHTEGVGGTITGLVGAKTCLDAGVTVSSALSHEVLETIADPQCDLWAQMPDGSLVAREVCDPVQDESYTIDVDGKSIEVSSYVLPAWFDDQAPRGARVDRQGSLSAAFTRTSGGYYIAMQGGRTSQVGARAAHKPRVELARGNRRLARGHRGLDEVTLQAVRAMSHEQGGPVAQIVHDVVARAAARAQAAT